MHSSCSLNWTSLLLFGFAASNLYATSALAEDNVAPAQTEAIPSTGESPRKEKKTPSSPIKKEKKSEETSSYLWPDWKPVAPGFAFQPVLGFQYSSDSRTKTSVGQAELGAYLGAQGITVVAGQPGVQLEPGIGYAFGQASVSKTGSDSQSGQYRRVWGGLQMPIYYRFFRQVFAGRYGVVSGGPLDVSKRLMLQSDSGVAVLPRLSAHYTLTYESSYGENSTKPKLDSYDHWIHARLSAETLNFFVDVGPGVSASTQSVTESSKTLEYKTSGSYFLALSGFDLFTDRLGMEAQAKYIFSTQMDENFFTPSGRSPLDDLGATARREGLPEDSFHASAFLGAKRILGGLGIGWRYSLEILNVNERNNTKQLKTESNGFGIFASVRF